MPLRVISWIVLSGAINCPAACCRAIYCGQATAPRLFKVYKAKLP